MPVERVRRANDPTVEIEVAVAVPLPRCARCGILIMADAIAIRDISIHRDCASGYCESMADAMKKLIEANAALSAQMRAMNQMSGWTWQPVTTYDPQTYTYTTTISGASDTSAVWSSSFDTAAYESIAKWVKPTSTDMKLSTAMKLGP